MKVDHEIEIVMKSKKEIGMMSKKEIAMNRKKEIAMKSKKETAMKNEIEIAMKNEAEEEVVRKGNPETAVQKNLQEEGVGTETMIENGQTVNTNPMENVNENLMVKEANAKCLVNEVRFSFINQC